MIYLKTPEEMAIIQANGEILGKCHAEVAKAIKPGVSTLELDKIAYEFIKDNGAHPSFLNYQVGNKKYAYSLCISVNDVVVHGSTLHAEDAELGVRDRGVEGGLEADGEDAAGVERVDDPVVPEPGGGEVRVALALVRLEDRRLERVALGVGGEAAADG